MHEERELRRGRWKVNWLYWFSLLQRLFSPEPVLVGVAPHPQKDTGVSPRWCRQIGQLDRLCSSASTHVCSLQSLTQPGCLSRLHRRYVVYSFVPAMTHRWDEKKWAACSSSLSPFLCECGVLFKLLWYFSVNHLFISVSPPRLSCPDPSVSHARTFKR